MSDRQASVLVWFRQDLRLTDHEPLTEALQTGKPVVGVYCYDRRQFSATPLGFMKTGPWRATFLCQAVEELAQQWRGLGGTFVIAQGLPETVIPALAQSLASDTVYYHQDVTSEERTVEQALIQGLATRGVAHQGYWGRTLYHPDDVPFTEVPDLFTHFRQALEKGNTPVRSPLPAPTQIPPLPSPLQAHIPADDPWPIAPLDPHPQALMTFTGGEPAALARVQVYIWDGDYLKTYKETRNGMLQPNDSSKFSPWLALGCLSPRWLYAVIRRYEAERVRNDSTYWLIFELLWRDFFYFVARQYGDRLFYRSGLRNMPLPWREDPHGFEQWRTGQTGYPLVDANMRELQATGFMSNRGRQNVASFLCKNLGIDWRWGAQWFESCLVDYDPCSNWGNWNYTAGIGNDRREFRYFNIPKQSRQYDPQGAYLRHWLPELAALPGDKIHEPWQLTATEQRCWGVILDQDYPRPCVDFWDSLAQTQTWFA